VNKLIASSVFLSGMLILLLFNWVYVQTLAIPINTIVLGAITGFLASIISVAILSGIQVLGTGLDSASIKILFGVGSLLNILFQVNIAGFPIGLGLMNNMMDAFSFAPDSGTFGLSLGFFISTVLTIMILVSGVMIIQGGE
jgi:hypothetical protein